jgi:hypothetical protein
MGADQWYQIPARLGNGTAQLRLGVAYEEGLGVPQDHVTAFMWFNIAASNNQPHAADFRDLLAVKMTAEEISEGQRRSRVCSNSDYHNHQDGHEYFGREKRL